MPLLLLGPKPKNEAIVASSAVIQERMRIGEASRNEKAETALEMRVEEDCEPVVVLEVAVEGTGVDSQGDNNE